MKFDVKNVFIAGGTGFLGYYSAKLFLEKGCNVSTIALPGEIANLDSWYPKEINKSFGNLFEMSEDEIFEMLNGKGYDTFIYGLGPDDRVEPKEPAYGFFKLRLVDYAKKICNAAKRAGIRRCVIMNSYFAYFDRTPVAGLKPGDLSKNHPYIKVRVEQAAELIALGEAGKFDVMILELPYIFGCMPGREPLWKNVFLKRFDKMPAIFFPKGGTNMIHVTGVAEAVVAAAYNGDHGERYPIGNVNMKYKDWINLMMETVGNKKRYVGLPASLCAIGGAFIKNKAKKEGFYSGLNYTKLMTQIQSKDYYFDSSVSQKKLGYQELGFNGGEDVIQGIKETMMACYPDRFKDGVLVDPIDPPKK